MKTATIQLETLTCPSCMQKIENSIKTLDGIAEDTLKVMFNSSFADDKLSIANIEDAITKVGYEVKRSRVK